MIKERPRGEGGDRKKGEGKEVIRRGNREEVIGGRDRERRIEKG